MNNAIPKVRTIRLMGPLEAKFGAEYRLAVRSPAEAVHALTKMVAGFEAFMMQARDNGLTFAVFNGARNIKEEELLYPAESEICIAPIVVGSKSSGLFQTIFGAALVAVGVVGTVFGGAIGGAVWGPALIKLGAAVALGGIVQLLSPQTATSSSTSDSSASYYFSGAVNSTAQGDPVPICYGRMRVGSKVLSSGIYASDQT